MTQEEKELLLKDLCARLPYGVKIEYIKIKKQYRLHELSEDGNYFSLLHETEPTGVCSELGIEYEGEQTIKPYLRPMSSMTEEEMEELQKEHLKDEKLFIECINKSKAGDNSMRGKVITHFAADWCHRNHFDYRGLIEKGLALEALEGMYKN